MSVRVPSSELVELQQFILNRETEETREELYQHLVARALCINYKDEPMTKADVVDKIKTDFGLSEVPDYHVENALARLLAETKVAKKNLPKGVGYAPTSLLVTTYLQQAKDFDELRERMKKKLWERMKARDVALEDGLATEVFAKFNEFLGGMFAAYGVCCGTFITRSKLPDEAIEPGKLETHLVRVVSTLKPEGMQRTAQAAFLEIIRSYDADVVKYLHSMVQSYVLAEVLNIDPDLGELEAELFKKATLYVDTNVLVTCSCPSEPAYDDARRILKWTRGLGVTLIVTDRTIEEYNTMLEVTGKDQNRAPQAEPFWMSFRALVKTNPSLTWEGYKLKMANIGQLLATEFGVKIDRSHYSKLRNDPEVRNLVGPVVTNALPHMKSLTVAEHDAFHLALVRRLSKGEGGGDSGLYWFLTEDLSLEKVERSLDARMYAVLPGIWLEIISPFLSPVAENKDASEVFVRILNSQLGSFALKVDDRQLVKWLMPWTDGAGFTDNQWALILANNYVQEHLGKVRSNLERMDDSSISQEATALAGLMFEELSIQQKKESEKLGRRIETLSEQIHARDEQLHERDKQLLERDEQANRTRKRYRWTFVGVVSALSLVIDSILYTYPSVTTLGQNALVIAVPSEVILILGFPALLAWVNSK